MPESKSTKNNECDDNGKSSDTTNDDRVDFNMHPEYAFLWSSSLLKHVCAKLMVNSVSSGRFIDPTFFVYLEYLVRYGEVL